MTTEDIALLRRVYGCIDHTTLEPTDNFESAKHFGQQTIALCKRGLGEVAAICMWPRYVAVAKAFMPGTGVRAAAVAGGFPHGQMSLKMKLDDISEALERGADEVDVVFPLAEYFGHSSTDMTELELMAMRGAIGDCTAKCIIESGLLRTPEHIARATQMVIDAGFDFVKTSTGKIAVGATPEAVGVMLEVLKKYKAATGKTVGLKVSGGVSTPEKALLYARMTKDAMGDEFIDKQSFRIGTSSLTERLATFLTKEISDC